LGIGANGAVLPGPDRQPFGGRETQPPISDYFRTNVFVTPGGVFSQRYLRWATGVGVERIMFSTDYRFRFGDSGARRFLADADLSDDDRTSIASGNWNRLCAGIRR
jgi:hypothetical protein